MTPTQVKEAELFEMLGRNEVFKAWLQSQLTHHTDILVHHTELVHLHRAQGCSQLLQKMLQLSNKK